MFLLLATFVFDWVEAWLTSLFNTAAAAHSIEPLLAWIAVGGAAWALVLARFARPAWPSQSAVGVLVTVGVGVVLSLLRKAVEPSLFTGVPMLAWLLLDKRLADVAPDTKPGGARPEEAPGSER